MHWNVFTALLKICCTFFLLFFFSTFGISVPVGCMELSCNHIFLRNKINCHCCIPSIYAFPMQYPANFCYDQRWCLCTLRILYSFFCFFFFSVLFFIFFVILVFCMKNQYLLKFMVNCEIFWIWNFQGIVLLLRWYSHSSSYLTVNWEIY